MNTLFDLYRYLYRSTSTIYIFQIHESSNYTSINIQLKLLL